MSVLGQVLASAKKSKNKSLVKFIEKTMKKEGNNIELAKTLGAGALGGGALALFLKKSKKKDEES